MNDILKNNMKMEQIQNQIDSINSIIDNNDSCIFKYYTESQIKALNRELDNLYIEKENIKIQNKYIMMNNSKDSDKSGVSYHFSFIFILILFIILCYQFLKVF